MPSVDDGSDARGAAAWLFPGQGSQYVGMASAWSEASAEVAATLGEASEVLGFDLARVIADGPEDALADTHNQQPAVLAASVAILRAARPVLPAPRLMAGHSLGEYSALVAAGALGFPDALRLVRERGRLMKLAGEASPGRMAAVLGMSDNDVESVCADIAGVQVANYNSPGQVVISGTADGVDAATAALEAAGARRVVPLPITIAAHSELMRPVADEFRQAVAAAPIAPASVPVVANTTARAISDPAEIGAELADQLTASVRWSDGVRSMLDQGIDSFYEVGPGSVLTGLTKRIAKDAGAEVAVLRSMDQP
ncbi:MAG: ACP S-malonyltransferase [Anaerolineae bacterium]